MINFNFYNRQIDLTSVNIKNIRCLQIRNFRTDLKFHFPPGAIEILSFEADVSKFRDSIDFFMHISSLRFLSYDEFLLPDSFFTNEHVVESLSCDEFFSEANGYLVSFCDFIETKFWNYNLDNKSFVEGFKLIQKGPGLNLFGKSEETYFGFVYQSID